MQFRTGTRFLRSTAVLESDGTVKIYWGGQTRSCAWAKRMSRIWSPYACTTADRQSKHGISRVLNTPRSGWSGATSTTWSRDGDDESERVQRVNECSGRAADCRRSRPLAVQ